MSGIRATSIVPCETYKCMEYVLTCKKFQMENSKNHELTEAVQAIRDIMIAALLRNKRHEGTTESQDLVEFRRNKPP